MGRTKSTPRPRSSNDVVGQRQEEVLGRILADTSVEEMLVRELQESSQPPPQAGPPSLNGRGTAARLLEERLQQYLRPGSKRTNAKKRKRQSSRQRPLVDSSDDDNDEDGNDNFQIARNRKAGGVTFAIMDSSDEEDGGAGAGRKVNAKKKLQLGARRRKQPRRSQSKSKTSRLSSSDNDNEGLNLSSALEVQVEEDSILVRPAKPATEIECKLVALQSWRVPNDVKINAEVGTMGFHGNEYKKLRIHTLQGAQTLLSIMSKWENGPALEDPGVVASAVQDGSLMLECCQEGTEEGVTDERVIIIQLSICLDQAIQVGNPLSFPEGTRKILPGATLQKAAAQFIPDDDELKSMIDSSPAKARSLTSKQVYGLVDNVQYNSFRIDDGKPLGTIYGLVPTLRPYQEAAVQWMLQRERGTNDQDSNEWELAWFVWKEDLGKFFSLLRCRDEGTMERQGLFYCPFMGWWAQSYAQAKSYCIASEGVECRGGILAESMGLGKTVEVLACILAHPAPQIVTSTSHPATLLQRRVSSYDSMISGHDAMDTNASIVTPEKLRPAIQNDFEDVSRDDSSVEPVPAVEERWIEASESIAGVCICGKPVELSQTAKIPFVICGKCREPMHAACADVDDFNGIGRPLVIRRLFCNDRFECRECPAKHCPCCVAGECEKEGLLPSRATVIVTPAAILNQWEREIQRHTSVPVESSSVGGDGTEEPMSTPLKVVVYPGIRDLCNQKTMRSLNDKKASLLHPRRLADADIVLMTFEALMSDLGHSSENPYVDVGGDSSQRSLRRRKLYRVVPSPLLAIRWWRVCLDEAQRVETPTAASARMALKLEASYRWCVSGTPIGRGKLDDLFGLLHFLRLEPFSGKIWFSKCFLRKESGLVNDMIRHLLRRVFWRSTKTSLAVLEQMGVPQQIEKKVILKFSSIERHFYQRQLEETLNVAGDVTASKTARKTQLDNLSLQLHKLRAACCHPQVGSSGLGRLNNKRRATTKSDLSSPNQSSDAFSRILTMDQILDRLIDDAKLKCEEAQRLALMHNNAMAALSKLKVEARRRGVKVEDSDAKLLTQSCKLYQDSLRMTEENSVPSLVVGEAMLSGCQGFRSPRRIFRNGRATLDWQVVEFDEGARSQDIRQLWSRVDFEGPAKKVTQIKVRAVSTLPSELREQETTEDSKWVLLLPKECVFQVSSAAVGGEFVDVVSFSLQNSADWVIEGNFRTNRSKAWRFVVKSYDASNQVLISESLRRNLYCGLEVELFEADIAGDSLQRLHVLHNACLSYDSLIELAKGDNDGEAADFLSANEMMASLREMRIEAQKIETLYIDAVIPLHNESQRQLELCINERQKLEQQLFALHPKNKLDRLDDIWSDGWWSEILTMLDMYGTEQEKFDLCKRVHEDLNSAMEGAYDRKTLKVNPFPRFHTVNGLHHGLNLRLNDLRSVIPPGSVSQCLEQFRKFPIRPNQKDIQESAKCQRCKADWTWTGAMCSHCQLSVHFSNLVPDRLLLIVLGSIQGWMKGGKGSPSLASVRTSVNIDERATLFFKVLEASKKERSAAERAWRIHLDLLNDFDELEMSKRAMRLALEGEDLSDLADAELNAIVHPIDVKSAFMDHGAKQAMALANLRRHKSTLRYLKNQSEERSKSKTEGESEDNEESCSVCLSTFTSERAVLACGHSFHYSPCLEKLIARSGNNQLISCPMRCAVRTNRDEVMMATENRRDDGSNMHRQVKGSWGTKVTRLVADVLDVSAIGEKSVVFSMWEDMLQVVEEALRANDISCVRATSSSKMGVSVRTFRSSDCSVLLLNVKNGAEGLTLVEATHIFMIEPLLNCGLDNQAINRIHRIGQTCKTYVHRYLIENTIEVKIDKLRMERQEDQIEDSVNESKKTAFNAGGIDGGFNSQTELLEILKIEP